MSHFGEWEDADAVEQVGGDAKACCHGCDCGAQYRSEQVADMCCGDTA